MRISRIWKKAECNLFAFNRCSMYYSSFSGKFIPHAFAAMSTNKDRWVSFLSSRDDTNTIKPGELPINSIKITTTRNTKCLATVLVNIKAAPLC